MPGDAFLRLITISKGSVCKTKSKIHNPHPCAISIRIANSRRLVNCVITHERTTLPVPFRSWKILCTFRNLSWFLADALGKRCLLESLLAGRWEGLEERLKSWFVLSEGCEKNGWESWVTARVILKRNLWSSTCSPTCWAAFQSNYPYITARIQPSLPCLSESPSHH